MSYNRDMPTGNCQKCINKFGTLGCCDTISNEWRYNCDDGMRLFDERKPMTNADRIRSMSDEELASLFGVWVADCDNNDVPCKEYCSYYKSCGDAWLAWLKEEVSE